MKKLVDGIHRFQSGVFGEQKDLFARLSKGQEPDALFITCSDSRVSPTLITQTIPGDLFILRNAGNIIPPYGLIHGGETATIEYAIEALAVKDIIICGHTHCGAMKAVLDPTGLDELPAVKDWLTYAEATRRVMRRTTRICPRTRNSKPASKRMCSFRSRICARIRRCWRR